MVESVAAKWNRGSLQGFGLSYTMPHYYQNDIGFCLFQDGFNT